MEEKQIVEKVLAKQEYSRKAFFNHKTAPNGMPVYDIYEPWVQQYIEDFGCEPSFF